MSKNMKYSEVREIIYRRYKGKCAICKKKILFDEMCINLITPKSKGGYKEFSNMQAVCEICGKMKNNLTQREFFRKISMVTLRNFKNVIKAWIKK